MKQLGNLAVICAQRPELLMQLRDGLVLVQARNRAAMEAAWNDDMMPQATKPKSLTQTALMSGSSTTAIGCRP